MPSKPVPLTTATLAVFDNGLTAAIIDEAIADAVRDCNERPNNKKPRSVAINISIVPVVREQGGDAENVSVQVGVKTARPAFKGGANVCGLRYVRNDNGKNELVSVFMPGSPSNPNQPTFDFDEGETP